MDLEPLPNYVLPSFLVEVKNVVTTMLLSFVMPWRSLPNRYTLLPRTTSIGSIMIMTFDSSEWQESIVSPMETLTKKIQSTLTLATLT